MLKRVLAMIGLAGMLALPATAAWAESPVALDPVTKIVDNAGVLGGKKADVEAAIKKLGTDHAMTLHVVYVKKFENPTDRVAWAAFLRRLRRYRYVPAPPAATTPAPTSTAVPAPAPDGTFPLPPPAASPIAAAVSMAACA